MPVSAPTRIVFWNILHSYLFYPLLMLTLTIFAFGIYRRIRLWRLGTAEKRTDRLGLRIMALLKYAAGHYRLLRQPCSGLIHLLIFVGFALLFIGTAIVSFDYDVWRFIFNRDSFLTGYFYLVFSLILDIAGVLAFFGTLLALFRRYLLRPNRLHNQPDDAIILLGLMMTMTGGFLLEASRIAATQPDWERWSPVGFWLSGIFSGLGTDQIKYWHQTIWWVHLITSFVFIAYLPYAKLFHIIASPLNIFFRSLKPRGQLSSMELESADRFGAGQVADFSWKHLLDLDACTRCGRCQDQCPAYLTGKALSPKKIIIDLKAELDKLASHSARVDSENKKPLVDSVVTADEIWACTTCRACMESCPVLIEHVDKIIDLRRERVLMTSVFPPELQGMFRGMENNSNPWNVGFSMRADWTEGLSIQNVADGKPVEYLWYVGCAASFDERAKKTARSFANILSAADVNFGILGTQEKCCGETARRLGNEYLAQTLIEVNTHQFNEMGIEKIITSCPHCYNTLKNEYPQFNGNYEVYHCVELILALVGSGRIRLKSDRQNKVTFHDSCYLGRYADFYEQPRYLLRHLYPGGFVEIKSRNRANSFCCGAGGGRMWLEETVGKRINHERIEQIMATGAEEVVSACPYCLTMFTDGIKDKGWNDQLRSLDILEIVEEAMIK